MPAEGSAYLDRSGRVLVADQTFRALLRLPAGDVSEAFRLRVDSDPVLADLVSGTGPDRHSIPARDGIPGCAIARTTSGDGMLLRVSADDIADAPGAGFALEAPPGSPDLAELAMQAIALGRLAGSVAHEVKNPLNAMSLQLALLGDKIATADERLADVCAANLASVRNQINRINEVVRRYVDVADPAPTTGGFDPGALLVDVAGLFAHELRRRRIALTCEASPGLVRAEGDGVRATRLLLGLVWRAVSQTPAGGQLSLRCSQSGATAELSIERPEGEPDHALAWVDSAVAAAARELGGRLEETCTDGRFRLALRLPKEMTP